MTIGVAARLARNAIRWTQEDVAEYLGVSSEFYARIERGNALPSVQTLRRLSACLRVDVDVLLGLRFGPPGTDDDLDQSARGQVRSSGFQDDGSDWRKLLRRLRNAHPKTLRLVRLVLKAIEERKRDR